MSESQAAVEVVLVEEVCHPPATPAPWIPVEIHTANSVYRLDAQMVCVEVLDRATEKPVAGHGLLGARLLGGQHQDGATTFLSHPYPRLGTEAVFEQAMTSKRAPGAPHPAGSTGDSLFSRSSPVTRVVLRIRQVAIAGGATTEEPRPAWSAIAAASRASSDPVA